MKKTKVRSVTDLENEADKRRVVACFKDRMENSEISDLYFFNRELVSGRDKVTKEKKWVMEVGWRMYILLVKKEIWTT